MTDEEWWNDMMDAASMKAKDTGTNIYHARYLNEIRELRELNARLEAENARLNEVVSELMHTLRMKVIRETQDLAMQKEAIAKAEKFK